MNITLTKDHLGLPRLPYSHTVTRFKNCSIQSSRDWAEITYWMGLYDADPILLECQLNHQMAQFEGDKSYWHDIALKRAEQLNKTFEEINRFGKPITQDMRVHGNPKYSNFHQNTVSNSTNITPLANSNYRETKQDRISQCEMFLTYLVNYPYKSTQNIYDSMIANLDNPSQFARLRSEFKKNISQKKRMRDCKD